MDWMDTMLVMDAMNLRIQIPTICPAAFNLYNGVDEIHQLGDRRERLGGVDYADGVAKDGRLDCDRQGSVAIYCAHNEYEGLRKIAYSPRKMSFLIRHNQMVM